MKTKYVKQTILSISFLFTNLQLKSQHLVEGNFSLIKLKSTSFMISTPIDVNCEKYENYFEKKYYNTTLFKRKKDQEKILKILNSAQIDTTKNNSFDVRAKIYIYSKNVKIEICVDYFRFHLNGKFYKMTKDLIQIIEKIDDNKNK